MFKGRLLKQTAGDEALRRSTILLVHYPSVSAFLNLMGNRYFNVVGLLRLLAVKDFTFGLTQPVSGNEFNDNPINVEEYVVRFGDVLSLQESGEIPIAGLMYSGKTVATLTTGDSQNIKEDVDCIIERISLQEADAGAEASQDTRTSIQGDTAVSSHVTDEFVGIFRRISV